MHIVFFYKIYYHRSWQFNIIYSYGSPTVLKKSKKSYLKLMLIHFKISMFTKIIISSKIVISFGQNVTKFLILHSIKIVFCQKICHIFFYLSTKFYKDYFDKLICINILIMAYSYKWYTVIHTAHNFKIQHNKK